MILLSQICAVFTYPVIILSIFTGKNFITDLSNLKCIEGNGTTLENYQFCEKIKLFGDTRFLPILFLYFISIISYSIALFLELKSNSKYIYFILVGGTISYIAVVMIIYSIIDFSHQTHYVELTSSITYVWVGHLLTIIFTLISSLISGYTCYKKLY